MKTPRTLEVIADQPETWCHLAPFGEYPYTPTKNGKPVLDAAGKPAEAVQVLDRAAFDAIAAAFNPADPVLLDREHWSLTTGDSTAMGWIVQLEIRGDGSNPEDGLWGLVRWTDVGAEAARNRRLRFISPVWDALDAAGRPLNFSSAGLTNTARFRDELTPITNKAEGDAQGATQKDTLKMDPKELAALLGLPDTATPEEITAALTALIKFKADTEAAALNKEAETAYEANKDKIANKAGFLQLYNTHPEQARAFVANLAPAAPDKPDPVTNKADAKRPPSFQSRAPANKHEQWKSMPAGAEKEAFFLANVEAINADAQ